MEQYNKQKMLSQLTEARKSIIEDIKEMDLRNYDGTECKILPKQHYENIKLWCINRVKNKAWSHNKSNTYSMTTYGLKHVCERDLNCYVANNWMKMALIDSGFEVANLYDVEHNSGKLYRKPIYVSEILTNNINFIFRKPKDFKAFDNSIMTENWINN